MAEGPLDRAYAAQLDARDPLASYRERFLLADPALVYLNGNSLGPLPLATMARIQDVLRDRRSAHHLYDARARLYSADAKLVGVRMWRRFQHARYREILELPRRISMASTSSPITVSFAAISSSDASVCKWSLSQDRVNFMGARCGQKG